MLVVFHLLHSLNVWLATTISSFVYFSILLTIQPEARRLLLNLNYVKSTQLSFSYITKTERKLTRLATWTQASRPITEKDGYETAASKTCMLYPCRNIPFVNGICDNLTKCHSYSVDLDSLLLKRSFAKMILRNNKSPIICSYKPQLSIVIPAFNEQENLRKLYHELVTILSTLNMSWEVIITSVA